GSTRGVRTVGAALPEARDLVVDLARRRREAVALEEDLQTALVLELERVRREPGRAAAVLALLPALEPADALGALVDLGGEAAEIQVRREHADRGDVGARDRGHALVPARRPRRRVGDVLGVVRVAHVELEGEALLL